MISLIAIDDSRQSQGADSLSDRIAEFGYVDRLSGAADALKDSHASDVELGNGDFVHRRRPVKIREESRHDAGFWLFFNYRKGYVD